MSSEDGLDDKAGAVPKLTLLPTAGIRVVACIAVIFCNVMWAASMAAANKADLHAAYAQHTWMNMTLQPELPVQTFLVLSGFLSALALIPSLGRSRSHTAVVTGYYRRRVIRLVPGYFYVLLLLHTMLLPFMPTLNVEARRAFFGDRATLDTAVCESRRAIANYLFQNNHLSNGGCYNTTWTLAALMQFYTLFPLALVLLRPHRAGFRRRIWAASAAMLLFTLLYRASLLLIVPLWKHMPLPFFRPYDQVSARMVDFLIRKSFLSLAACLGPLCLGVMAALAVTHEACLRIIARHSRKLRIARATLALLTAACLTVGRIGPAQDPGHTLANPAAFIFGFVIVQGLLHPLLAALNLMLTTTQQGGWLAKLLSSRLLCWLAPITYEMYLLNPLVICAIMSLLPPSQWFGPDYPELFLLVASLAVVCTILLAYGYRRVISAVMSRAIG